MDSTIKTILAGLIASFVLGGVTVYASDQNQDEKIAEIKKEAEDHEQRIRAVENATISMESDVDYIKASIDRIETAIEKIAE